MTIIVIRGHRWVIIVSEFPFCLWHLHPETKPQCTGQRRPIMQCLWPLLGLGEIIKLWKKSPPSSKGGLTRSLLWEKGSQMQIGTTAIKQERLWWFLMAWHCCRWFFFLSWRNSVYTYVYLHVFTVYSMRDIMIFTNIPCRHPRRVQPDHVWRQSHLQLWHFRFVQDKLTANTRQQLGICPLCFIEW